MKFCYLYGYHPA